MERYNRINLDGIGLTENLPIVDQDFAGDSVFYPGMIVRVADGVFVLQRDEPYKVRQMYVLGADTTNGKTTADQYFPGELAIGNYLETGRTFAVLADHTKGDYEFDQPLVLNNNGLFEPMQSTPPPSPVLAFCKEDVTADQLAEGHRLIKVRIA